MYQIRKSHLPWKPPTPELISWPEIERRKITDLFFATWRPCRSKSSQHACLWRSGARSILCFSKRKKEKKKQYVWFFVFWIDHFSFKNPHLYKIKNNPLSIWGTIFPTLEKTVCLWRSHLDKTESHVVCKLSVLSDKIFSKKQNTNFLFNIAYSSYEPWFVNYKLFCKVLL